MPTPAETRAHVAGLFDRLAPAYDQGPVPWFTPMAARLVELVAPAAGERALDIGPGRGAATFPLCEAVGPTGRVTAIDLAPGMAARLTADAERRGVTNLDIRVGLASPAALGAASYDLVTASLVLFFDPEPEATLADWVALVRPGGRIGLTTFGPQDQAWRAAEDVLISYGPHLPDPRSTGTRGPYATTDAMAALLTSCGAIDVDSHDEPLEVVLSDAQAWHDWSMTLGMRQFWDAVPPAEHAEVLARVGDRLEADRGPDGLLHLVQQVRYTTGRVA